MMDVFPTDAAPRTRILEKPFRGIFLKSHLAVLFLTLCCSRKKVLHKTLYNSIYISKNRYQISLQIFELDKINVLNILKKPLRKPEIYKNTVAHFKPPKSRGLYYCFLQHDISFHHLGLIFTFLKKIIEKDDNKRLNSTKYL